MINILERTVKEPFALNQHEDRASSEEILFIGNAELDVRADLVKMNYEGLWMPDFSRAFYWLENRVLAGGKMPVAIITDFQLADGNAFSFYFKISSNRHFRPVPFIVISQNGTKEQRLKALKIGVDDFYIDDFTVEDIHDRIQFLQKFKRLAKNFHPETEINLNYFIPVVQMPLVKRLMDIVISASALIILSPVFIIIAILIKLESKGPVFYVSKRAGKGYRIFNFYKFRSMSNGADAELDNIRHLNQYAATSSSGSFVKIENDPRVTRFGKFLRNTSIDELPQFINVLVGDMSLVGNRPLPLYEAERLTRDQWAKRFLAPAGITGLWQVTKRGKGGEMSEEERMELDMAYAEKGSFLFDLTIILKTIPALFQKDNV